MTEFEEFAAEHPELISDDARKNYTTLSIPDLMEEFQDWMLYTKNYSKKTVGPKVRKVYKFFEDTELNLEEVTLKQRRMHKAFLLEKVKKGDYTKNYVSTILTDLNVFFCHFLGKEDLRVPSVEKEEISFERLTRDDIDAMVNEVANRTDIGPKKQVLHKAIILTLWNELPRVSELCDLKLGDIKTLSRKVQFQSRKRKNVPKHLRHPFATQEFLAMWNEYKRYRDSDDWSEDAPAFVQVKKGGRPLGKSFVRRLLKEYGARAGIDKYVSPHIIRKSGGTELSMQNPKLGQIQLGHKNIKTTLTNYTGPNEKDKQHIDTILTPHRELAPEALAQDLSTRYVNNELPTEEYIKALKALRTTKNTRKHDTDPAFQ